MLADAMKRMVLIALLTFSVGPIIAQTPLYNIQLKNTKQLHHFFQWTKGHPPIVSGHRGGDENGFPENSIETFERTLQHTPAIFEVDPRITKDSVIVLIHDATLERTTNGRGKVADYTVAELKQLYLKDRKGNITPYRIPTLTEALNWAKGKTILNFDKKDVPLPLLAKAIKEHQAESYTMITVHNGPDALFHYQQNPQVMFSAFVKTPEQLQEYEKVGIPYRQMIAYIGPTVRPENQALYRLLHSKGIMCMISSAPSYDKLATAEERASAYQNIIRDGATILESDLPIEVGKALNSTQIQKSKKSKYYKIQK